MLRQAGRAVIKTAGQIPAEHIMSARRLRLQNTYFGDILATTGKPVLTAKETYNALRESGDWMYTTLPSTILVPTDVATYHSKFEPLQDGHSFISHQSINLKNASMSLQDFRFFKDYLSLKPGFVAFAPANAAWIDQLYKIATAADKTRFLVEHLGELSKKTAEIMTDGKKLTDTILLLEHTPMVIREHGTGVLTDGQVYQHVQLEALHGAEGAGVENHIVWSREEHGAVALTIGAGTQTVDLVDSVIGQSMRTLPPDLVQIYRDWKELKPDMSLYQYTLEHHPDVAAHIALHATIDGHDAAHGVGRPHEDAGHGGAADSKWKYYEPNWRLYVEWWDRVPDWQEHASWADNNLSKKLLDKKVEEDFKREAGDQLVDLQPRHPPFDAKEIWDWYLPQKDGSLKGLTKEQVVERFLEHKDWVRKLDTNPGLYVGGLKFDALKGTTPSRPNSWDAFYEQRPEVRTALINRVSENIKMMMSEQMLKDYEASVVSSVNKKFLDLVHEGQNVVEAGAAVDMAHSTQIEQVPAATKLFNDIYPSVVDATGLPDHNLSSTQMKSLVQDLFHEKHGNSFLGDFGMVHLTEQATIFKNVTGEAPISTIEAITKQYLQQVSNTIKLTEHVEQPPTVSLPHEAHQLPKKMAMADARKSYRDVRLSKFGAESSLLKKENTFSKLHHEAMELYHQQLRGNYEISHQHAVNEVRRAMHQ